MANEIQILHDDGAETLYAIVRNMAGQFYDNTTDHAFEAFAVANWATYKITLTEVSAASSGNVMEKGTFPAVAAGFYWLDVYVQGGANPAQTDHPIYSCLMYWNGTALMPAGASEGMGNIDSTGGSLSLAKAIEALMAWSNGRCVYDASTGVATYYGKDGTTVVLSTPLTGGGNRSKQTIV